MLVACPTHRDDWSSDPIDRAVAEAMKHTAEEREALADRWTRDATYEHASIASFARVTLDLLALGAPAALVSGAQRAGLDEVEHARIARFERAPSSRSASAAPASLMHPSATASATSARSVAGRGRAIGSGPGPTAGPA